MSSSHSISNKPSAYRYAYQPNQRASSATGAEVVSVSDDASVQGETREKIAGSGAGQRANLSQYRHLLNGHQLPVMTQLMSGEGRVGQLKGAEAQGASLSGDEERAVGEVELDRGSMLGAEESSRAGELPGDAEQAGQTGQSDESRDAKGERSTGESTEKSMTGEELTRDEQQEVDKLQARDREVRAHEQAHVAAGGQYVRGGISYDYQRGPDGRNYAVGGHVNIDVSEARTPEATIVKMQQVKRAALAPAEPSGADRAVAAAAGQKEQQARAELLKEQQEAVGEARAETTKRPTRRNTEASTQSAESSASPAKGVEGAAQSASPAPAEGPAQVKGTSEAQASSSVQAPEPPKVQEHMNLAREARMRIKRGISWLA